MYSLIFCVFLLWGQVYSCLHVLQVLYPLSYSPITCKGCFPRYPLRLMYLSSAVTLSIYVCQVHGGFLRQYWFAPKVTLTVCSAAKLLPQSPAWSFTLELNDMLTSQTMSWPLAVPPVWIWVDWHRSTTSSSSSSSDRKPLACPSVVCGAVPVLL